MWVQSIQTDKACFKQTIVLSCIEFWVVKGFVHQCFRTGNTTTQEGWCSLAYRGFKSRAVLEAQIQASRSVLNNRINLFSLHMAIALLI